MTNIGGPDHIGLHCSPKKILSDPVTNLPKGVISDAFKPRPEDANRISAGWIEFYGKADVSLGVRELVVDMIANDRVVRTSHAIALSEVAEVLRIGTAHGNQLTATHDGLIYRSHSTLGDISEDDSDLQEALANSVDMIPVSDVLDGSP